MNVKSKFDIEEEYTDQRGQYIRGGCGTTISMISEATRMDLSNVRAPKFIKRILQLIGRKTEPEKFPEN
jgi:hypothetical protein